MSFLTVCAVLLLSAAPDAGSARPEKTGSDALWNVLGNFDEYPGAAPYQLSDEMKVGQASLRMAGFTTSDPPEKVIAFYHEEFTREKLFIPDKPDDGIPFSGITAFDPGSNLEKTVMVSPGNGGPTRVVLSISPSEGLVGRSLSSGTQPPAGLPVFVGSDGLYRTDAQDGLRSSSTVSYRAPTDPRTVLDFIRKNLSDNGWVQAKEQGGPGGGLRYERSGEAVEITLLPLSEKMTAVTYVYVH
ncbi:MAG TPA: hypothetical protein VMB50_22820 [Myxococcales bacterium]|nr:hypothetical protein [Myxococcales bacterium]